MEAIFLGTGAAEAIPSMFCRCKYCEYARKNRGNDIRTRSSLKLGENYMFDFSPDANFQHMREKIDFYDLKHLMITHSHDDHMAFTELMMRSCAVVKIKAPVNIYMSEPAAQWLIKTVKMYGHDIAYGAKEKELYNLVELKYFNEYKIGEYAVFTIKGSHNAYGKEEFSINYMLRNNAGKKMLYAVDTGYYLDETWEYLSGHKLDKLVLECTFGGRNRGKHVFGHMDCYNYIDMLDKMLEIGTIDNDTEIFATHINHKHDMMHKDMQEFFDSSAYKVKVAYDGMKFEF